MKTIIALFFVFFLLSCNSKHHEEEKPLTLDEIVEGDTISDSVLVDTSSDSISLTFTIPFVLSEQMLQIINELGFSSYNVYKLDTLLYVDRYSFATSEGVMIQDGSRKLNLFCWNFSTVEQGANAFKNWLQCYGSNCQTIPFYSEKSVTNERMGMILIGKSLFYLLNFSKAQYEVVLKKVSEDDMLPLYAFYQNGKKGIEWFNE